MSLSTLLVDIKTKIFGSNKAKIIKISPVFDTDDIHDLESLENGFYKRVKERELDLYSNKINYDVEKGDLITICNEVSNDINIYKKYKIIDDCVSFMDDYVSFMDVINYFSIPTTERETSDCLPIVIDDISNPTTSQRQITIEITCDDCIDVPLHLYKPSIL